LLLLLNPRLLTLPMWILHLLMLTLIELLFLRSGLILLVLLFGPTLLFRHRCLCSLPMRWFSPQKRISSPLTILHFYRCHVMEVLTSSFLNDMKPTSDNRSSIMTMALVVTSQFDAMSESEDMHKRKMSLGLRLSW
jgi:hypothetical protein